MTKYKVVVGIETELDIAGLEEPLESTNVATVMASEYIKNLFEKKGLVGFANELRVIKIEKV